MIAFFGWLIPIIVVGGLSALTVWGSVELYNRIPDKRRTGKHKWLVNTPMAAGALLTLVAAFSPMYYEFPDWPDKLYAVKDGQLVEQPWGAFEYGKELAWVTSPGTVYKSTTSVTPITANPKVRRILYQAEGSIVDATKFLAKPEHRHLYIQHRVTLDAVEDDVTRLVQYCQYELNNAHSTELAEFYNPLDVGQTQRFRILVEGYLNTCLTPDGVKVKVKKFDLS